MIRNVPQQMITDKTCSKKKTGQYHIYLQQHDLDIALQHFQKLTDRTSKMSTVYAIILLLFLIKIQVIFQSILMLASVKKAPASIFYVMPASLTYWSYVTLV